MSTESELQDWRRGQIVAERLCAEILVIEGFENVDPQAPLGGPDEGKDILAHRDGRLWVAAVFFPPTRQAFPAVEKKFATDFDGVARNGADAFAFFVNQPLTIAQRRSLRSSVDVPVEIYHLERLRGILDTPLGNGPRSKYLDIAMTVEDQSSFVLALEEGKWGQLQTELQQLRESMEQVLDRTMPVGGIVAREQSSLGPERAGEVVGLPMETLTVDLLIFVHRLVAPDALFPGVLAEDLRPVDVRIAGAEAAFHPPSATDVPSLINAYVTWWRATYPDLIDADPSYVVGALAELHHRFLSIHPFVDGNGRVARALLEQAARELLGKTTTQAWAEPARYLATLRAADKGDLEPLRSLIRDSLT